MVLARTCRTIPLASLIEFVGAASSGVIEGALKSGMFADAAAVSMSEELVPDSDSGSSASKVSKIIFG